MLLDDLTNQNAYNTFKKINISSWFDKVCKAGIQKIKVSEKAESEITHFVHLTSCLTGLDRA